MPTSDRRPYPNHYASDPHYQREAARWSRQWLALGLALLLVWPEARGHSALLGWLPFWLVLAPALVLAMVAPRATLALLASLPGRWLPARSRPQAVRVMLRR